MSEMIEQRLRDQAGASADGVSNPNAGMLLTAAAEIARLLERVDELETVPPECSDCMELRDEVELLREARDTVFRERDELKATLGRINDIRNSIVGCGTVNWSEHIYPLVAMLNKAGLTSVDPREASENFGTLLERATKAEARVGELEARVAEFEAVSTEPTG